MSFNPGGVKTSDIIYCDASTGCPEAMGCCKFQDNNSPCCYSGDPCIKCGTGRRCITLESCPLQIKCE